MQAPRFIIGILLLEILFGVSPKADRAIWALENFPVWIGLIALGLTYRKFPLSRLCLFLLAGHALVLMVGGYYTYAKVPLGDWVKEMFHLSRNHYDRLGHFVQGFVPAILVRELLMRQANLRHTFWLPFTTIGVCLGFSALYELFEWGTSLASGDAANDFLGTQGDPWDTQSDMFCALLGAITSVLIFKSRHNRSIALVDPGFVATKS